MTATAQSYLPISYSLDTIKDEARQLIETGVISPQQSIYTLWGFNLPWGFSSLGIIKSEIYPKAKIKTPKMNVSG